MSQKLTALLLVGASIVVDSDSQVSAIKINNRAYMTNQEKLYQAMQDEEKKGEEKKEGEKKQGEIKGKGNKGLPTKEWPANAV